LLDAAKGNEYPSLDKIAIGMEKMLGCLHWHSGLNGHDIEFIMGGASFSGVMMNVIDFNQVHVHFYVC
jgi:hypothetical protein